MAQVDRTGGAGSPAAAIDRSSGQVGNMGVKNPCVAVSVSNLTLSGEQTVNGIACVTYDRVLVKAQTNSVENGIWVVSTGAWNRAADFDGTWDAVVGTTVVAQGNYYSVASIGTIGTDAVTFNAGVAPGGAADIHAATSKSPLVGADEFGFWDSVSGLLRKISYTNILTSLGSTFAALAGSVSQTFSVATATSTAHAPQANQLNGRNLVVNASCMVDQVNGGTLITPLTATYPIDNVYFTASQASKLQTQRVVNKLNSLGASHALRTTVLASYTAGASEWFTHLFPIEGINAAHLQWGTANAAAVSLQFKALATISGTYSGVIRNAAGNRSYPFSFALTAGTDTLVKVENITGDTSGTWPATEALGLYVGFDLGSGASVRGAANAWTASTVYGVTGSASFVGQANGSELTISDVQLEKGAFCTQFERKSYRDSLAECQRYLPVIEVETSADAAFGMAYSIINGLATLPFKVPARIPPTGLNVIDPATLLATTLRWSQAAVILGTATPTINSTSVSAGTVAIVIAGATAGYAGLLTSNGANKAKLIFTGAQI